MAAEDLPSEFDVVILGTGLAESVVAAACSRVGQRVLHVDRRSYYAANWASFTFNALLTWIQEHQAESLSEEVQDRSSLVEEGEELIYLSGSDSASISNLQVFCYVSEEAEEEEPPNTTEEEEAGAAGEDAAKEPSETESAGSKEEETGEATEGDEQAAQEQGEEPEADQPQPSAPPSQSEPTRKKISYTQLVKEGRRFNIDLVSKLMYSRGSLVDLLIKSNVSRYAEFKNVTRILTYRHGSVEQIKSVSSVLNHRRLYEAKIRQMVGGLLWMRPACIIIRSNRVELCGGGLERLQSGAGRSIMVALSPALIMTALIISVLIKRAERVTARLEDDSEFLKCKAVIDSRGQRISCSHFVVEDGFVGATPTG
ncbi:rab proteins geranylgeranyltransferase component A 1, partial [Neolamprologus brichardi]|uniref:rab proteins geranylgeranyltransferase component A 1 n=1 Tax=Neolamprologus brichardi TaxID=32507 RepID=UPI001643CA7B